VAQWVRSLDLTTHTSLSPIRHGFAPGFVDYKKGCSRLASASDKVYQLLGHGRWFSPGTPASSITITGRHDIAEILLKVALKHQKSNQTNVSDILWNQNFHGETWSLRCKLQWNLSKLNLLGTDFCVLNRLSGVLFKEVKLTKIFNIGTLFHFYLKFGLYIYINTRFVLFRVQITQV
jgi:hypothetical protein